MSDDELDDVDLLASLAAEDDEPEPPPPPAPPVDDRGAFLYGSLLR